MTKSHRRLELGILDSNQCIMDSESTALPAWLIPKKQELLYLAGKASSRVFLILTKFFICLVKSAKMNWYMKEGEIDGK